MALISEATRALVEGIAAEADNRRPEERENCDLFYSGGGTCATVGGNEFLNCCLPFEPFVCRTCEHFGGDSKINLIGAFTDPSRDLTIHTISHSRCQATPNCSPLLNVPDLFVYMKKIRQMTAIVRSRFLRFAGRRRN